MSERVLSSIQSIAVVWQRSFATYRKDLVYGLVTTFVEPILYLASFGFGLGSVIGTIKLGGVTLTYRAFVLAGLIGQTILFTAFFDGAFGGFVRMYYQKIFQAIAVTPVTLSEVLWGELLWCASRAMLSVVVVLVIGVVLGDFSLGGSLAVLPLAAIAALLFAAFGMLVAALSRTIESISYPQYLVIFPMFLFCGVYFPITQLPMAVQWVANILPLTALLSLSRALVLGTQFEWWALPSLLVWTMIFVFWARRAMLKRLTA
jgi:lipooligosaccharide transport system permease protein